jgi:predicted permease
LLAKAGDWAIEGWTYPDYQVLRDADHGMAITGWTSDFSEYGEPAPDETARPRVSTLYVSSNYFTTFGVTAARGQTFAPAIDDAPSGEARVIVSDDFWRSRLAGDPDIIGKSIKVNGVPHTVIGITPPDFRGHFHFFQAPGSLLFVPLERHPKLKADPNLRNDRNVEWVRIHARLNDGIDITRANQLVTSTMAGLAREYPSTNEFKSATVEPYVSMGAAGRPEQQRVFTIIFSLAGAVLLVVCLNISGMMLVRGANRERELSIRAALGAARQRLIQHLFFEALLLAVIGASISAFVLYGIPAVAAWYLGAPVPQEIDFDVVNALSAAVLCLGVSLLFGLLPAVRFSRPNLITAMKDDAGGGGSHTIRVHRAAAMVQIGIAVPFLVVAGVMLDRVRTADFGFPTDGIAGARLPKPAGDEREANFAIRRVRDNLQQANGVRTVALADGMPIDFDYRLFRIGSANGSQFVTAHVTRVGENFLEAVGAPLLRGRTISAEDRVRATPVAVISQPLATVLFGGKEAIGEQVTVSLEEGRDEEFTVIGVSADFATSQLTTERPQILLPLPEQLPSTVHLIARGAAGDEPKLKAALEQGLRELGVQALPGVAFPGIVIGQDLVDKSLGDLVSESIAVGFAGGVVLILAALGIVGVVGFMVATRTKEIAVRMALGSTRLRVFGLMQTDIVKLVIPGVAGGLLLAAVFIRTVENVMDTPLRIGPDPLGVMELVIYAGASAIAIGVAMLAGFPAARRATAVQPMVAIRTE